MSDVYAHWRARLKTGADLGDPSLPYLPGTNHDTPQPGMYRVRERKGGDLVPMQVWLTDQDGKVAHVWADDLEVRGTIDNARVSLATLEQRWHWAKPVTKDAFSYFKENGRWEDDAPGIGDNSGDLTPLDELQDYMEQAGAWIKGREIADEKTAEQAGNMIGHLASLKSKVDKEREAKVRPHLDAQRDINKEYKPHIEAADNLIRKIKDASTAWLAAERRRKEAEARAAYEAEQKRLAEERAQREAEREAYLKANPIAEFSEPEPDPEPELPMAPEPVKVAIGGARGRKVSLRTFTVHEIADVDKVFQHFRQSIEVHEVLQRLVNAAYKRGDQVPGVKTRTEERAA